LSFEAALAELEGIVRQLETGDVALDQSVALYARGDALRAHCEARLASAQARIEQISVGPDGQAAGTTPFAEG
jgi:exodeoxyribonuclease VII small subunit